MTDTPNGISSDIARQIQLQLAGINQSVDTLNTTLGTLNATLATAATTMSTVATDIAAINTTLSNRGLTFG